MRPSSGIPRTLSEIGCGRAESFEGYRYSATTCHDQQLPLYFTKWANFWLPWSLAGQTISKIPNLTYQVFPISLFIIFHFSETKSRSLYGFTDHDLLKKLFNGTISGICGCEKWIIDEERINVWNSSLAVFEISYLSRIFITKSSFFLSFFYVPIQLIRICQVRIIWIYLVPAIIKEFHEKFSCKM